jgi:NADH-quinone oxidoreductase subunit J
MNTAAFVIIAVVMLAAALAAASLKKLIHAALFLALSFVCLAAFYFLLGAEFVGLVQIFVYVGAVAILIVFTILLTRREAESIRGVHIGGVIIPLAVFAALARAIFKTPGLALPPQQMAPLTVRRIGEVLMTGYIWPLLCVGLLLTAALIGALVIVSEEKR